MRNIILTWIGVVITFIGTFLAFAFSPTPLALSEQLWYFASCALVVLILVFTYRGHPRDLARSPSPTVRALALIVMVLAGGGWLWFLVRTFGATGSDMWGVRVQRTLALFLFAGAYYLFTQKARR